MKLIIKDNYVNMCDWAANHIADAINNHKEDRPFILGLPTGSSPLGVYKKLIEMEFGMLYLRHIEQAVRKKEMHRDIKKKTETRNKK